MNGAIETIPGGRRVFVTVPATAGNVVYSKQVPRAELRWHLVSARLTLVCDGTVASRTMKLRRLKSLATGVTSVLGMGVFGAAATAGQTKTLACLGGYQYQSSTSGEADAFFAIEPLWWMIENTGITNDPADMCFHVEITNGVAGDSFSGVMEFLEVPA